MQQACNRQCANCSAPQPGKTCRHCGTGSQPVVPAKPARPLFPNPVSALINLFVDTDL